MDGGVGYISVPGARLSLGRANLSPSLSSDLRSDHLHATPGAPYSAPRHIPPRPRTSQSLSSQIPKPVRFVPACKDPGHRPQHPPPAAIPPSSHIAALRRNTARAASPPSCASRTHRPIVRPPRRPP
ncbi:uncharacterized protein STEHIDRAFT_158636 [Stereum hirsutum FP-91666 SS1]|uniref:uncharacterized protein n=1 Tax=Stereum hirsutum (strain FP-91666) TaxID=721885 RepID=UPI000444955B|nr:uncharacterized protein STEHIDRAFT_158636 [Stereum hirsutum FP-91666 SS1]EIM84933.1 hypothetical protein STEHIDRAFT_158636 [Stereum hirsutum FP-91666 SS1]